MKERNGFTMTELMISIVIISIVMAFLVNLLIDINYEKLNELYDTANNVNRAEMIKTIENDFKNDNLTDYRYDGNTIRLTNSSGEKQIILDRNTENGYISYTNGSKKYKWKIEYNNDETHIYNDIVYKCIKEGDNHLIIINIPIIVNNSKNPIYDGSDLIYRDSKMDDITLTFYSNNYRGTCEI